MIRDLTEAFAKFNDEVRGAKEKCLSDLERLLDRIRKDLGGKQSNLVTYKIYAEINDRNRWSRGRTYGAISYLSIAKEGPAT